MVAALRTRPEGSVPDSSTTHQTTRLSPGREVQASGLGEFGFEPPPGNVRCVLSRVISTNAAIRAGARVLLATEPPQHLRDPNKAS